MWAGSSSIRFWPDNSGSRGFGSKEFREMHFKNAEDYSEIARRLFELLDEYFAEYEAEIMQDEAA